MAIPTQCQPTPTLDKPWRARDESGIEAEDGLQGDEEKAPRVHLVRATIRVRKFRRAPQRLADISQRDGIDLFAEKLISARLSRVKSVTVTVGSRRCVNSGEN